jgi:hypothetical protein
MQPPARIEDQTIGAMHPLFRHPRALSILDDTALVHPLAAYPHLDGVLTVPVLLEELVGLASLCPTAFMAAQEDDVGGVDGVSPVAVLGLAKGTSLARSAALTASPHAPLVLKAYPLAAARLSGGPDGAEQDSHGQVGILLDQAPVETLAGASPAVRGDGSLSLAAQSRIAAALAFATGAPATAERCAVLHSQAAFEPWPIRLTFQDREVAIGGLLRLRESYVGTAAYREFCARFPGAGPALEAQRQSRRRWPVLAAALEAAATPA